MQDNAENNRKAETGFPVYGAFTVPNEVPEKRDKRDRDQGHCEHGTKFNDQFLYAHFSLLIFDGPFPS
jgi:hypothetical protein